MSSRLERLVYESHATGSTGSLLNLATILAESQRNNDRDGLTGVLAAHDERYVQVVEGGAETLDLLLRRLQLDPRHRDVRLLERRPIETRIFAGWSMASPRINPATGRVLGQLMADPEPSAHQVVELLRNVLVKEQSRTA